MAYLLDTHIVLWLNYEPHKITYELEQILLNKNHKIYFSSVNIWEVAIKSKLGKLDIVGANPKGLYDDLLDGGYDELAVLSKHCIQLENLPFVHRDPFDRLLISQAMSENLTLITYDNCILKYDCVKTLKI